MITYNRSAFGLNLIFQVHGSAVYRAVLPSLIAVGFFFLWHNYYEEKQDLGHPYAVGALIASASFLVVFRANQGYARYWEGCTAVHHMMSKWMDATTHAGVYHLQCDHYKDIKPPSYFEYRDLNHLYLTRDRERGVYIPEDGETEEDKKDDPASLLNQHHRNSQHFSSSSSRQHQHLRNRIDKKGAKRKHAIQEEKVKRRVQAVVKSINYVPEQPKHHRNTKKMSTHLSSDSTLPPPRKFENVRRTQSMDDIDKAAFDQEEANEFFELLQKEVAKQAPSSSERGKGKPFPLWGRPKLDGGWGDLYTLDASKKLAIFSDPTQPNGPLPQEGFASTQGGRTPPLYMQELVHLSSLLVAVALSTLRNDIDGCESPLAMYDPGSDWPAVDPDMDDWLKLSNGGDWTHLVSKLRTFLGMGRSPKEQTKYNAGRPLPVLGGVSDAEIRFLQLARGPYAKTQLCWNWLSEFMMREHLAGSMGKVGPPIVSRCIQFLGDGMIFYNHARKIMFIPFPFVHAQLSVLFIVVLIPAIPFLMDQWVNEAWAGATLSFLTILCLAGVNEVARELENPFRNVPNELPLVTFMAQFNEALITMYSGYHPDFFWDGDELLRQRKRQQEKQQEEEEKTTVDSGTSTTAISTSSKASDGLLVTETPIASGNNNNNNNTRKAMGRHEEPLTSHTELPPSSSDKDEIALLKDQLAQQAKLIEQLCVKVGQGMSEEKKDS
mmetsp:Transcript_93530/g.270216  ORF Transcript_93530/g.270216 Transcript_93530/m.270216 type:complete len:719 (-) Transcript_93530:155-2311(-)